MLVLLIIFMVAAPMMNSSVNVDLPRAPSTPVNQDTQPLTVSVNADGKIFLQNQEVELPELVAKLQAVAPDQKDRRIFVRGDKANTYGRIVEVMGTIIQGGFTKVALLCDQPAPAGPTAGGAAAAPSPATPPAPQVNQPRQGRG
jgi:biopolymer transport protein TolR